MVVVLGNSVTNYFLVNLSVADLLVTFICMPMAVGQSVHRLWLYGEAMCKLTYYLQGVSVGASVFTITAMSIDRYLAIRHPMAFRKVFNRKSTLMVIVVLWCVSLAIFVPLLWVRRTDRVVLGGEGELPPLARTHHFAFCLEDWPPSGSERRLYGVFCFVLVYAAPGTVVILAYALMGRSLCAAANAAASGRHPPFFHAGQNGTGRTQGSASCSSRVARERRRAARILLLLALLFAACWLPYNVLSLLLDLRPHPPPEELIMKAFPFTLLLGHANSAINPVLYCFMTNNFRRTVKAVLRSPCTGGSVTSRNRSRGLPMGRRGPDTTTEGAKLAMGGKRKS
ncbi:orexin receptor type 2-like [Hetaerina americana]|uniref:orexin receptor type 2-like n=1 Tax=Hetaerina americana TaxID=62018 RepID=UPI003A7F5766